MDAAWRIPNELPDLRRVELIALDTETRDNSLNADRGSGWATRDGYLCGVSVAYRAGGELNALYFPLRHPDSNNFDADQVYRWLKDHVASDLHFVTQNGTYDWGWLRIEADIRMPPSERIEEIGALATLINENLGRYSLDALCKWRGLPGKNDALLRAGCEALGLIQDRRKKFHPQSHLWQLPASYVGPYAETDARSTLLLFEDLTPILRAENTVDAYRLEIDILPLCLEMRRRGIRVNIAAAEKARDLLLAKRDAALVELSNKLKMPVSMHELDRNQWLAKIFEREGISYPRTPLGNPSFTGGRRGWMLEHPHWLPQLIGAANKYDNAGKKVVETYILGHLHRGRVFAEVHPHRTEGNRGTRSFRFSYSSPPLQQMPVHDPELGPLIRGVFLPEEGEVWCKPDCSQQEFRFLVHYAAMQNIAKADIAVARYLEDPNADFHAFTATMTSLDRDAAKAVNFAKIYGAGVRKFAEMIHKSFTEAQTIYAQYDRELPFLNALNERYKAIAARQGYILLFDGARRHFNQWAPGGKWSEGAGPCSREEAERRLADASHPWFAADHSIAERFA